MEAIILAGGLGKRLRSVVGNVPKPMALIGNVPFLEILMLRLQQQGVTKFILSVNYLAHMIENHFGNSFNGLPIVYAHESEPLGTGGAIRLALTHVKNEFSLVVNGDSYIEVDLSLLSKHWLKNKKPIIVGCHAKDASRYGRIVEKNNIIIDFIEKGQIGSGTINAGCYILSKDQLKTRQLYSAFSFENDYLPDAILKTNFYLLNTKGLFIDIGVPDDFEHAQKLFKHLKK